MLKGLAFALIPTVASVLLTAVVSYHHACAELYGASACVPVLTAWLPSLGDPDNWWWHGKATRIHDRDGFRYGDESASRQIFGLTLKQGTFFVREAPGPPKGRVIYDAAHRIALYEEGCCTAYKSVAADHVPLPPRKIVDRDLSQLKTVRGLQLGDSMERVLKVYGPSRALKLSANPGLVILAYTTWPPFGVESILKAPCGQVENFAFRHERLVYIEFGDGC
ncbi:MAG: hypothetical protein M3Z37_04805 [Candidatus Eremiobacteraeota bacterium]|nr:hypothetical protein [Candidatus Eremiobacteraeota bacterium]